MSSCRHNGRNLTKLRPTCADEQDPADLPAAVSGSEQYVASPGSADPQPPSQGGQMGPDIDLELQMGLQHFMGQLEPPAYHHQDPGVGVGAAPPPLDTGFAADHHYYPVPVLVDQHGHPWLTDWTPDAMMMSSGGLHHVQAPPGDAWPPHTPGSWPGSPAGLGPGPSPFSGAPPTPHGRYGAAMGPASPPQAPDPGPYGPQGVNRRRGYSGQGPLQDQGPRWGMSPGTPPGRLPPGTGPQYPPNLGPPQPPYPPWTPQGPGPMPSMSEAQAQRPMVPAYRRVVQLGPAASEGGGQEPGLSKSMYGTLQLGPEMRREMLVLLDAGPPPEGGEGEGAGQAGALGEWHTLHRRSCMLCSRKKKKCDGDGSSQCSRCRQHGLICHYKRKRKPGPRASETGGEEGGMEEAAAAAAASLREEPPEKRPRGEGAPAPPPPPPPGPSSISRNGLVGHRENMFLSTFLCDLSTYMPMANDLIIRTALVEMMGRWAARAINEVGALAVLDNWSRALDAVLWGCIAIGSIMQGVDNDCLGSYLRMVRQALQGCWDVVSPLVVRAHLVMATIYDLQDDKLRFRQCYQLAKNMVMALPPEARDESLLDVLNSYAITCTLGDEGCDLSALQPLYEQYRSEELGTLAWSFSKPKESLMLRIMSQVLLTYALSHDQRAEGRGLEVLLELQRILERANGIIDQYYCSPRSPLAVVAVKGWLCYVRLLLGQKQAALELTHAMSEAVVLSPGILRFYRFRHIVHIIAFLQGFCRWTAAYQPLRTVYNRYVPASDPPLPPLDELRAEGFCPECLLCQEIADHVVEHYGPPEPPPAPPPIRRSSANAPAEAKRSPLVKLERSPTRSSQSSSGQHIGSRSSQSSSGQEEGTQAMGRIDSLWPRQGAPPAGAEGMRSMPGHPASRLGSPEPSSPLAMHMPELPTPPGWPGGAPWGFGGLMPPWGPSGPGGQQDWSHSLSGWPTPSGGGGMGVPASVSSEMPSPGTDFRGDSSY